MKQRVQNCLIVAMVVAVTGAGQLACRSRTDEVASAPGQTPSAPAATQTPVAEETPPAAAATATPAAAGTPLATAPGAASSAENAPGRTPEPKTAVTTPTPTPTPPRRFTLSSGRTISVYTSTPISTKTHKAGDTFTGSLSKAIVDGDWVIAKQGAPVEGVVTSSDPGGRVKGVASIAVALKELTLADGSKLAISTTPFSKLAPTSRKKDATKIGIGAGVGAAIGAIAGGGKGAAIGAGVGGGAGTAATLATRGDPAVIPDETLLTFRLSAPTTVTQR
ncbi:MAG: hypothetical protein J2P41_08850 [Blastocatellia bacterium]|nr:hypothetical protein [Blastocatellia bacterium]